MRHEIQTKVDAARMWLDPTTFGLDETMLQTVSRNLEHAFCRQMRVINQLSIDFYILREDFDEFGKNWGPNRVPTMFSEIEGESDGVKLGRTVFRQILDRIQRNIKAAKRRAVEAAEAAAKETGGNLAEDSDDYEVRPTRLRTMYLRRLLTKLAD